MRTPTLHELLGRVATSSPALTPRALERLPDPGSSLEAVLTDLWNELFGRLPTARFRRDMLQTYTEPATIGPLLLALWLLQAPSLRALNPRERLEQVLLQEYPALLALAAPEAWFSDPERREELVRFWLRVLGIQPLDESPEDSAERWEMVSSERRKQLFALLRQRRRRDQAIREAQARRAQSW